MTRYVKTFEDLQQLAVDLEGSDFLAIDTEFMREKTYFAKLCVIQVNNGQTQALVDALAIEDLSPLAPILTDKDCTKIFHAASQDIEVLFYAIGVVASPIFDTQVAASVLGFPLQTGYGSLVQSICNVRLAKADGYTDWARRPLTKNQISYAMDDVVYLPEMYQKLTHRLESKGRERWLEQDFANLCDKARFVNEPLEMWHHVKRISSLNRLQLAIVREVAAWREQEAMRRDQPRKWVLADEAIVEIARKAPRTKERLFEIRGLEGSLNRQAISSILECVQTAKNLPPEHLPQLPKYPRGEAKVDGVVDLMAALVDLRAHQNEVATPALASREELTRLARGHRDDSGVLKGWRYEMIGKELVALLEGHLCLRVDGDSICVSPC